MKSGLWVEFSFETSCRNHRKTFLMNMLTFKMSSKAWKGKSIISKPSPEQVSLDIDGRTGGSFCQPAIPGMCLLYYSLGEGRRKQEVP